jgi:hypothetical protein
VDELHVIKAPKPIDLSGLRGYSKAVKEAFISLTNQTGKCSRKTKDLLAEACLAQGLPSSIPNFLEMHNVDGTASYALAKPVMDENAYTVPVKPSKDELKIALAKLLEAKGLQTVKGTRLLIPISAVNVPDFGAALLLHLGTAKYVLIKKKGAAPEEPDDPDPSL